MHTIAPFLLTVLVLLSASIEAAHAAGSRFEYRQILPRKVTSTALPVGQPGSSPDSTQSSSTGGTAGSAAGGSATSTPAPRAELSTTSLDFGPTATNTSVRRQVLLSNGGNALMHLSGPPVLIGSSDAYGVGVTNCGSVLDAGQSCATEVVFAPETVGNPMATLSFPTDAPNAPVEVALSGIAYNPVTLDAATLPYGVPGNPYAGGNGYDFKPLLHVSNETAPDPLLASWTLIGTLPTGMSLSNVGVLSGTPTEDTGSQGRTFSVQATYRGNVFTRQYTVIVTKLCNMSTCTPTDGGSTAPAPGGLDEPSDTVLGYPTPPPPAN
jgi:hypothetical protein